MFGNQAPSKDFDLDELLNSTLKDVDDDFDMNDPELLKQLQELSPSQPKKQKKPAPTQDIDIDSYAALAQADDDDIHVELHESDLTDPHLLKELSSLDTHESTDVAELVNMGFSHQQATKALGMFDHDLERAANYLFDTPPADDQPAKLPTPINYYGNHDEDDDEEHEEEESTDPQYWKEKAQEYQRSALAAKKEGDKKKAVALLRESKAFNQKYQDLLEIQPQIIPPTAPSPPAKRDLSPPPPPRAPSPAPAVRQPSPVKPSTVDLQKTQNLLEKVIVLQKQYKEAALHYKKLGNLAVAKQMVRTSKELLHTGISLKNGQMDDVDSIKLPEAPDMTLGDGKIRNVSQVNTGINSFEQIESQLTYQLNICHNLSIQHGQGTKKKNSSKMLNSQDNYGQLETAFASDLVSLKSYQSSNFTIPSLHYEQVDYTYKNILDTIPDNIMEFKIIRAISLPTLGIAPNLDPFVTWDFGGWPPENTAQASMNKGETPILQGVDPQFDFSLQIPISRTNRLFTRYVQRKKLTIEVFHNKYAYGMFRRPVSIGKVIVPMDRLLTKSSISGVFDILDPSRKKTGGKIEIQVNLREPLTGEDIVKRSERWLVLDSFGSTASQYLAATGLTVGGPYTNPSTPQLNISPVVPQPVDEIIPSSVNTTPINTPSIQTPSVPSVNTPSFSTTPSVNTSSFKSKKSAAAVEEEGNELEQAEEEFNSVDNIVSNMVMEHELGLVNAGLAKSKDKEDLMDRKQALEIKMNMLVIQVQTGMLDMDTYLGNVQKRMESDRRLAIVFKKHDRLDLARAALVRKKIMQDELDEARAAMEEE